MTVVFFESMFVTTSFCFYVTVDSHLSYFKIHTSR